MKVGIITIHKSPSYGGSLQAYALYQYIKRRGLDTEIIDLLRPTHRGYRYSIRFLQTRCRRIDRLRMFLKALFNISSKGESNFSYNDNFKVFNLNLTYSNPYKSVQSLFSHPPIYDIYITGSDQVWNPTQPNPVDPYFLAFVNKGFKISYAASVGVPDLLPHEKIKYKRWIEEYDFVSVREDEIKTYLEAFVNKTITRVADPTFLLDKAVWDNLCIKPSHKDNYLLLFELNHNEELVQYCGRLSKEANLKLVVLGQMEPDSIDSSYKVVKNAGPCEFLGYIRDAEMVITDSFHATVFSIILGTNNFYTYIAPGNNRGSRITNLLSVFNLKNHLLNPDFSQTWSVLYSNMVNHETVKNIYSQEQTLSREFLDRSLDACLNKNNMTG